MNNANTLPFALLIHSLLHSPDGPAFDKAARLLHDTLRACNEAEKLELRAQFLSAIFRTLSDGVMGREGTSSLALLRYALEQHRVRRVQWLEDSYTVEKGDINDSLRVQQQISLMASAKDEAGVDGCFRSLGECVLQKCGTLLEDCLPQIEFHLTEWMADALEAGREGLDLSTAEARAITLFRLLTSPAVPICDPLALITGYQGELFLLTPQAVHTVGGKEGKTFLKRELDRLMMTLPLLDFLRLLSLMSDAAPEGNPVSRDVLDHYCRDLQDMFTPVH